MVGPSQTAPNRNFTSQLHVVTAFKHFPFLSSPRMKWDFQPASGSRHAFPECTWGMQLSTAKLLPCQCQSCRRERGDWAHHNKPGSCACRQAPNYQPRARGKGKNSANRRTTHMCYQGTATNFVHWFCYTQSPIFTEWVKRFEISFCLFTEQNHKENHNEGDFFFFPSNKHQDLTSCTAFSWSYHKIQQVYIYSG